jgi:MFS superfamily sulfate permease-like transporter
MAAAAAMSRAVARLHTLSPRAGDWYGVSWGRDVSAGVMVALVALPLALGFGVSAGLGAGAGVITAIVAGAVAAIFGGSRVQVSGPTGAMSVVLIPIFAQHGRDGVLTVGILAGLLLLVLALTGAGKFIRYVPTPVVEGFTIGIALIIALQQVPLFLNVDVRRGKVLAVAGHAVQMWLRAPDWPVLVVGVGTAGAILFAARHLPRVPVALPVVIALAVLNSRFEWGLPTIGSIPTGLPAPSLPAVPWASLDALVLPAVAVAALAALESLLSASVADAMSIGQRHDPDRELFGQGLANLVSPLFGGIPATAALARTAVNVRAGATSRAAALVHAVALLAVVLLAARWVEEIPLAALAAVLVATAVQMVRFTSLMALLRSTRGDASTLVVTAGATLVLDLVQAVLIGLVVAGFFALRATARTAGATQTPLDPTNHGSEEQALLDEHIIAYRLDGPLFFGAAHDFLLELAESARVRVVILRMSHVTTIDATGAHVLADTITRLERRGVTVLLSGVQPAHRRVLHQLGVYGGLAHERHLFATTPEAIAHARVHAARVAHLPDQEAD